MKRLGLIPKAPVGRIMLKAGAERISDSAVSALADVLEDFALGIARHAIQISRHAGRKTVNGADIELAGSVHK